MKSNRILVLMHEQLVPPTNPEDFSPKEAMDWRTERDVLQALRAMGHQA